MKRTTETLVATKRTRGHSPTKVLADLRADVRGAMNYYGKGMKYGEAKALGSWMRSRMRLYYWKQWCLIRYPNGPKRSKG